MPADPHTTAPVAIISDDPAGEAIEFGYTVYARTLAGMIAGKDNATPMGVGIYGPWGGGKTSLMNAIRSHLDGEGLSDTHTYRPCKTVWFKACKYDREEQILPALIESIFKAMAADGFFGLAKSKIEEIIRRIDQSKIFASVSRLVSGMDISEFFCELENKEMLEFYDTFQKFCDDLVWTFFNWRFKLTGEDKPDDKRAALVIFIDDLDRCAAPHIVKTLETVARFTERSGYIFVFGANRKIIEEALAQSYGKQDALCLLEKIVQVQFSLPPIASQAFECLLDSQKSGMKLLRAHLSLLMPAVGHTARGLKQFINSLSLLNGLLHQSGVRIDADMVVLWCLIQQVFESTAEDFRQNSGNLFLFQEQIKRLSETFPETRLWQISASDLEKANVPPALRPYFQQPHLAELAGCLEITPETLDLLQVLSAAVCFRSHGQGR